MHLSSTIVSNSLRLMLHGNFSMIAFQPFFSVLLYGFFIMFELYYSIQYLDGWLLDERLIYIGYILNIHPYPTFA